MRAAATDSICRKSIIGISLLLSERDPLLAAAASIERIAIITILVDAKQ